MVNGCVGLLFDGRGGLMKPGAKRFDAVRRPALSRIVLPGAGFGSSRLRHGAVRREFMCVHGEAAACGNARGPRIQRQH